jgi:hypothetical protein
MASSASRLSSARGLTAFALVASALALAPGTAGASAPLPNEHNCAGTAVSGLADPSSGSLVSSAAQVQVVDNFGFAACGQPPRQNP